MSAHKLAGKVQIFGAYRVVVAAGQNKFYASRWENRTGMDDLVYDVGMNDGADSAFYLRQGYRVLAIEANPELCERARDKYSSEINSGQLTILNVAVTDYDTERELDFYVNLDLDQWSSLDPIWGTREGTRFKTIKVRSIPFCHILVQYGIPHYLKVDVEGADLSVLRQLHRTAKKPQFISVEEHDLEYFPLLWGLGYRGFKIVNQADLPNHRYDGWQFERGASGPFGDQAPGQWMPFGDAVLDYMLNIRDCRGRELFASGSWFDIHATLDVPNLDPNQPYPAKRTPPPPSKLHRLRSSLGRLKRKFRGSRS